MIARFLRFFRTPPHLRGRPQECGVGQDLSGDWRAQGAYIRPLTTATSWDAEGRELTILPRRPLLSEFQQDRNSEATKPTALENALRNSSERGTW